jgi:cytochrome P450
LLERRLLEWARAKRGKADARDVGSIIVNNPNADRNPPSDAALVGQIPSRFAAAFEAGHSALTWTLLVVAQHPQVALQLRDELGSKMGRTSPWLSAAGELSYLDAVVMGIDAHSTAGPFSDPRCPMRYENFRISPAAGHPRHPQRVPDQPDAVSPSPNGDVCRPEGWLTIAPAAFEFFPVFSGGSHGCPGHWFGSAAVKIALTAMLTRYRLVLAPDTRIATAFSQPGGRCSACTHVRCRRMARLQQRRSAGGFVS